MSYTECSGGHIYDADKFSVCPYCNNGGNRIEFGGMGAPMMGSADIGKTVPLSDFAPAQNNNGPVVPNNEIGATVAPMAYQSHMEQKTESTQSAAPAKDDNKTVAVFSRGSSLKSEPVVGWLVCIDGPDKGKDYRIVAKNNSIGRSDSMDICIKGDKTISRENQARVAYDEKHNEYYLVPAESVNNVYIDDQPIFIPTKLNAKDVIEMGETKLMFIPLCDDGANWKDGFTKKSQSKNSDD